MAVFLVTGNPGSGKTTLAGELLHRGVVAMDADVLAHWESLSGAPTVPPRDLSEQWLRCHRWVWPRAGLEHFTREHVDSLAFLCGIAMNQREMLDLFSGVFLLSIDEDTQIARLDAAADRDAAARAQVLAGRPVFEAQMRAAGALVLDGSQPTAWLADRVLLLAAAVTRPPS